MLGQVGQCQPRRALGLSPVRQGDELAEVGVAARRLGQQRQVRCAVTVRQRDLRAQQRLDPRRFRRADEGHGPVQPVVIGEGQRGHFQGRRVFDQSLRRDHAVQQAVAGMGVQFDVLSASAPLTSATAVPDTSRRSPGRGTRS